MEIKEEKLTMHTKELNDLRVEKETLTHARARDEAILTSIGDGLVATGKDGNIVLVNRAFEVLLGWKESEVQGRFLSQIVPMVDEAGKSIPELERLTTKAIKEQGSVVRNATMYYKRKDGTLFPVALTVAPIFLGQNLIGAVEVFRDITKEKEIEKLRMDFLSLASHQLRTPLSGTKWLIETLQRKILGPVNKKQAAYIDQIYQINERMIKLVFDMLNALRFESGAMLIKKENISAQGLYEDLSISMMAAAKSRGIILRNVLNRGATVEIRTDRVILRSILECFVSNAINYSGAQQEVFLDAKEEAAAVVFSVRDSGIGIPKEEQKRIFERFSRASNAKVFRPDGSGLGLYIAFTLAGKIGAKVSFESVENKGSTFCLCVPKMEGEVD